MNRTIPRQDHTLRRMTAGAMLAAVIALTTAYLFHIPVGGNGGYIHIGDAFVYPAGSLLPTPYACAAAALGGGLADLLSGSPIWLPATVVIMTEVLLVISAVSMVISILLPSASFCSMPRSSMNAPLVPEPSSRDSTVIAPLMEPPAASVSCAASSAGASSAAASSAGASCAASVLVSAAVSEELLPHPMAAAAVIAASISTTIPFFIIIFSP